MKKWCVFLSAVLVSGAAHAHSGHAAHDFGASAFAAGLAHPLLGWDHLLAMLAVGLWSARQTHRLAWSIPLGFVAALVAGLMLGAAGGWTMPAETGIAASLLVLGLLLATGARLPLAAGYALAGGFAVFHGFAHGVEMPAQASALSYGLGMVLTTLALHFAGFFAGRALTARTALWRVAGLGIGSAGLIALAV